MDDPSNWISPSKALGNWEVGTSTFLMTPKMSVNWSLKNRTFSESQTFRISDFDRPAPAASNFSTLAFAILVLHFLQVWRDFIVELQKIKVFFVLGAHKSCTSAQFSVHPRKGDLPPDLVTGWYKGGGRRAAVGPSERTLHEDRRDSFASRDPGQIDPAGPVRRRTPETGAVGREDHRVWLPRLLHPCQEPVGEEH